MLASQRGAGRPRRAEIGLLAFTVESISPHRVVSDEEERPEATDVTPTGEGFASMILDNLRRAGVQNTVRGEHLSFDSLGPLAGVWLHARGSFTDRNGAERTVGVSLGPEYGTVDGGQVKEAAKEALRGAGVDLLLVCGFAFDPDAGEKAKEFQPEEGSGWAVAAEERSIGRLPVMLVKMNPDLAMGDDLLKTTGVGNLLMVFGEPDVEIERTDDGRVEVEIRGVDVYDPTTGALRSNSVDDIACWMIDTSYGRREIPTPASRGRCARRSARMPGPASTGRAAGPSTRPRRAASP